MKIVFICNKKRNFKRVYDKRVLERMSKYCIENTCYARSDFDENIDKLYNAEIVFSTWGMPVLSKEEIQKYLPNVKAVFYAAGTVQSFVKPFLELGIKVFSAAIANGIPVAEYTFAQIVLAAKGYFRSAKQFRICLPVSALSGRRNKGNYYSTVGLVGLGAIGSIVAEKLKSLDVKVIAYDPFISEQKAEVLGVELVSLERLFSESDVISNHLANKPQLKNIFNKKLFKLMKTDASFINTARGAQVNEFDLAAALLLHRKRTAIIDVMKNEIIPVFSPLWWCPNAILTPHIAGSTGYEVTRMADYMVKEYEAYILGEKQKCEVTLENLSRMA